MTTGRWMPLDSKRFAPWVTHRPPEPTTTGNVPRDVTGRKISASASQRCFQMVFISCDVRAVFSWSYQAVSDPAARLFRQMGLHPGPDLSLAAASSLAGTSPAKTAPLLAELARAHLVTEPVPDRFTFHDLLRAYARELSSGEDDGPCVWRMFDHYLHSAYRAALRLNPHRSAFTLEPACDGVTAEEFASRDQALAWFTVECPILLAAIEVGHARGMQMG